MYAQVSILHQALCGHCRIPILGSGALERRRTVHLARRAMDDSTDERFVQRLQCQRLHQAESIFDANTLLVKPENTPQVQPHRLHTKDLALFEQA
jgi:hypothetical protein